MVNSGERDAFVDGQNGLDGQYGQYGREVISGQGALGSGQWIK